MGQKRKNVSFTQEEISACRESLNYMLDEGDQIARNVSAEYGIPYRTPQQEMGMRIKERRKYHRMSQQKLADEISHLLTERVGRDRGVGSRIVGYWESGKHTPSIIHLFACAEVLECHPDYLVGTSDVPELSSFDAKEQERFKKRRQDRVFREKRRDALLEYLNATDLCEVSIEFGVTAAEVFSEDEFEAGKESYRINLTRPPLEDEFAPSSSGIISAEEIDVICDHIDRAIENVCRSFILWQHVARTRGGK